MCKNSKKKSVNRIWCCGGSCFGSEEDVNKTGDVKKGEKDSIEELSRRLTRGAASEDVVSSSDYESPQSRRSGASLNEEYIATANYIGVDDAELAFNVNDVINVFEIEGDRARGELLSNGKIGWFLLAFVQPASKIL